MTRTSHQCNQGRNLQLSIPGNSVSRFADIGLSIK
uniref:Uncharacterized protein n=1 Tax=Arundo donax TaxID=35708 RepID=A0A0A9HDS6_ARUDO